VDLKLTDKIALVTGSTAGIGFAIAQALAIEGVEWTPILRQPVNP